MKDVPACKAAAKGYLGHTPLPSCLPRVPPCAEPESVMEEGPDARCAD